MTNLAARLHEVSHRAFLEARAGAPAGMVAFYVTVETEHVGQGHDGNAQDCDPCNDFAMAFRRDFDAARRSGAATPGSRQYVDGVEAALREFFPDVALEEKP